jgi:metallo-beta-lactamase family protein
MYLTSYGAVREVTGSMHVLTVGEDRIVLDCGMFQGRRKVSDAKNRTMPIDSTLITNVILSHAHIDHSGRIPLLTKNGFRGRVIATRATSDACHYMLRDSAHIQESDAQYLNYKTVRSHMYDLKNSSKKNGITNKEVNEIKRVLKKGPHRINSEVVDDLIDKHHLKGIEPLYTMTDAEEALEYFEGYPYRHPVKVGADITCTFYDAGHILGSAMSMIKANVNGRTFRVLYSGDIGRFDKPIIEDPTTDFPEEDRNIDLLIMESTYGNREHDPVKDLKSKLREILLETHERGGSIVIPSFAFGRTQELIYLLHEIYNENQAPRLPVYIDSPLAINLTKVFGEHPEVYDRPTHETFLQNGENPFMFDQIHFVRSVEESMELMKDKNPNIVISASGMCESGRILHHLRYKIHDERNTVLIVGYMAQHTLGRRMLEAAREYEAKGRNGHAPIMKFMNKTYPLHAHVSELGGFSAHGDKHEMLRFLEESRLNVKTIALVHGEDEQIAPFGQFLKSKGYNVIIPRTGEIVKIN